MTLPRVSLLISTYERPDALAAVLRSASRQTLPPHQIVVGDDGSGEETRSVVRAAAQSMNVIHRWLPHEGFQLARMRNYAAAVATGDYLVIIDDDILLHPDFIADHAAAAREGFFNQGSRILLGEKPSAEAAAADKYWPAFTTADIGNRKNLIRSLLLSRLFGGAVEGLRGIRTCNFALWRRDFEKVNGFNEDFRGWGREDSEFVGRLFKAGLRRRNLRFAASCCHLHHPPRSRDNVEKNDGLLAESLANSSFRCGRGLNLHTR
jgi:glycosyltransferase involved in cell wall biosynthesis